MPSNTPTASPSHAPTVLLGPPVLLYPWGDEQDSIDVYIERRYEGLSQAHVRVSQTHDAARGSLRGAVVATSRFDPALGAAVVKFEDLEMEQQRVDALGRKLVLSFVDITPRLLPGLAETTRGSPHVRVALTHGDTTIGSRDLEVVRL